MSRYHYDRDTSALLDAAQHWRDRCLIQDGSAFSGQALWKPELLEELDRAFVQNPLEGNDTYLEKLQQQLANVSPEATQLMAELNWVLLLFPHNIKPETKRDLVQTLWELGEEPIDTEHPMLSASVLGGAANAGTAFNTHRWRELVFLIQIATAFKALSAEQREQTISDAWRFSEWLASVPREGLRQFRHIVRWLLFPDQFERICTSADKRALLEHFDHMPKKQLRSWSDLDIDKQLLALRQRLEREHNGEVDFYDAPWLDQWRPSPGHWLLAWNPENWAWESFQDDRLRVARNENVTLPWRTASSQLKEGDTAYIMRLGKESKGLIARGTVASAPYENAHYDPALAVKGKTTQVVDITLTDLRDPETERCISLADLNAVTDDNQNWTPQGSGIEIKPRSAKLVASLWSKLPPVKLEEPKQPTSRQQAIHIGKPVNQIFYGPPGTGKTHHWRSHIQPKYERAASQVSTGEWLEEQLADTAWWEAVALALADLTQKGTRATVNELLRHPYFKAKTRVQGRVGSRNLRAQCSGLMILDT